MKLTAFLFSLLPAMAVQAQYTDSLANTTKQASATFRPLYSLKRADLERIPASNFLELVNGAFPFVASDRSSLSDYSFIVDGHLIPDPQLINTSQIAQIEFYPQGTPLLRGNAVRRGTFVICSTTGEKGFRLYANGGVRRPGSELITIPGWEFPIEEPQQSRNYYQGELQAGIGIGRGRLNSAFQYLQGGNPTYTRQEASENKAYSSGSRRYRLSNFFELPLGKQFRLQLALMGAQQTNHDSLINDIEYFKPTSVLAEPRKAWSLTTSAGISFDAGRWQHQFNASWNGSSETSDLKQQNYERIGTPRDWKTNHHAARHNTTVIRHTSTFTLVNKKEVRLDVSVQLFYRERASIDTVVEQHLTTNGYPYYAFYQQSRRADNNFQVTPGFLFDLKHLLQSEFYVTHDRIKGALTGLESLSEEWMPQGALRFNAQPLIKSRVLSRLEVGIDYRKRRLEEGQPGVLDEMHTLPPSLPTPFDAPRASTWTAHLHTGFFKNRLLLGVQYIRSTEDHQLLGQTSIWTGFTYITFWRQFERRAIGLQLRGEVLRKENLSWVLQATAYRDDYSFDETGINPLRLEPFDANIDLHDKTILRSGLQTWFRYKGIHLQAAAMGTNNDHAIEDYNNGSHGYFNQWRLTQLVAGYQFSLRRGKLASIELNGHLLNAPVTRSTPNSLYRFRAIGAGLIARLR